MNMKKEIRAELRTLNDAEAKIWRDMHGVERSIERELKHLEKVYQRECLKQNRFVLAGQKRCVSAIAKIEKRRAILNGRLA